MHNAIKKRFPNSRFPTTSEYIPAAEWVAQGKPHVWKLKEDERGYQAWVDTAHGFVALTYGERLLGVGTSAVSGIRDHNHVALLDRDYFNTPGYLFFRTTD